MDFSIWWNRKSPNFKFGKVGAWIRKSSVNNPKAFDSKISWFIGSEAIFSQMIDKAGDRKVVLGYNNDNNERNFMNQIARRSHQISAAVWDYETRATQRQAIEQLTEVHGFCKSLKIPFGIAVLAEPNNSLKINGVAFNLADQFCDFLMPMLYSAWWNHNPTKTRDKYLIELKTSSVPLIPIIARHTTSEKIKQPILTSDLLISNYKPLNLKSFVVWNVADVDREFWSAAKKL